MTGSNELNCVHLFCNIIEKKKLFMYITNQHVKYKLFILNKIIDN